MLAKPGVLLRVEGLFVFALAVYLYRVIGAPWWIFIALLLLPDLSILGYLVSARFGARSYNLIHTYVGPITLSVLSFCLHEDNLLLFALVWFAHIGIDRALGFGLKYPTFFKDTHLQHVS